MSAMAKKQIPRQGHKSPRLYLNIDNLRLDPNNPRLPEDAQGKKQPMLLEVLYKKFNLDELADSMAQNGYFDEEPLVAIPHRLPDNLKNAASDNPEFKQFIKQKKTIFIVVEGNRRLATAKILLDIELRKELRNKRWPELTQKTAKDLTNLPVIIYKNRSEIIPYLGVRHILGIQKWDSYAKARYVAKMVDDGYRVDEIETMIADKRGSARRNYICFKLLEQIENEFDIDSSPAKANFSLLLLAIGQGKIKRFLGLPKSLIDADINSPVPMKHLDNLKYLISWIFGDDKDKPVIDESRDITRYLSYTVDNLEALNYLIKTRNLSESYDRSDGEETMLMRYLTQANRKLEVALGISHRHKTNEVISETEKCSETIKRILESLR
jgi:hypothetical protein